MAEAPKAEVFEIPPGCFKAAWPEAEWRLKAVPGLDLNAQRKRLLTGEDRLWLALYPDDGKPWGFWGLSAGVILTRITEVSPAKRAKAFPPPARSLTVHLAEGVRPYSWISSAVEKITRYAREEQCRQLFVLARKEWRNLATRFYSSYWEAVGYARDRPTGARNRIFVNRDRPGHYRRMQPVQGLRNRDYNTGSMCFFEERQDAAV